MHHALETVTRQNRNVQIPVPALLHLMWKMGIGAIGVGARLCTLLVECPQQTILWQRALQALGWRKHMIRERIDLD
jgi:hypothetical protein